MKRLGQVHVDFCLLFLASSCLVLRTCAAETTRPAVDECFSCADTQEVCSAGRNRCTADSLGQSPPLDGCYVKINGTHVDIGCLGSAITPTDCANASRTVEECLGSSSGEECLYCCYSTNCNFFPLVPTTTTEPTTATTTTEPTPTATPPPAAEETTESTTSTTTEPSTTTTTTEPTPTATPPPAAEETTESTTSTTTEPSTTTTTTEPTPTATPPPAAEETTESTTSTTTELSTTTTTTEPTPTATPPPAAEETTESTTSTTTEPTTTTTTTEPTPTATPPPAAEETTESPASTTTEPTTTTTTTEPTPTATPPPAAEETTESTTTTSQLPAGTSETTISISSSTTVGTPPARNDSLRCYICNNESPSFCDRIPTDLKCLDIDDVCYTTVVNGSTSDGLRVSRGCMARNNCSALQQENNELCNAGSVSSQCTVCCETNLCNINDFPPRITTVAPTTPPAVPVCDMVGYEQCLLEFQLLVLQASKNPDLLFNHFCGSMSSVFRCLVYSIEGCTCNNNLIRLNETLEAVLGNLSSQCPETCDPPAGFNCSRVYYDRVTRAFGDGSGCVYIEIIHIEQERCRAKTVGSCDVAVRERINNTYSSISREWIKICQPEPPAITPPTETESSECVVEFAMQCILDIGFEIIDFLNYGGDIKKLCADLIIKEQCYLEISATCSNYTRFNLELAWNVTKGLIVGQCVEDEKPRCDTTKARECILDLWKLVDEAKDFQAACDMMQSTIECVVYWTAGCSLDDQLSLNRSLQIVIDAIGNSCDGNIVDISPSNGTLDICEGGPPAQILYQFHSAPASLCPSDTPNCRVFVEFEIELGTEPRCRNGKVIPQAVIASSSGFAQNQTTLCSREVTQSNWNVLQNVSVAAKLDFKFDGNQTRNLTVWLRKVDASGTKTIEQRSLAVIKIKICDRDHSSTCSSINDPHTTTFDGRYYNNFQEGFFILYRHKTLPYEAHIITQRCNGQATCNCGAGVMSGDTVFFVDRCRKKSFVNKHCGGGHGNGRYSCKNLMSVAVYAHTQFTPGTRIFSRNNGKDYYVWLPHGTVVKISVSGDYLNVWVTPSPADWELTEGLCGFYNGQPSDDLKKRNGEIHEGPGNSHGGQPVDFCNNWRVQGNEMIYGGVSSNPFWPPMYCECRANQTVPSTGQVFTSQCGYSAILETCDRDSSGVEITINSTFNENPPAPSKPEKPNNGNNGHNRRRRATDSQLSDFDIDTTFVPPPIPSDDSSVQNATLRCQQFFDSVEIFKTCSKETGASTNESLSSCVEDLLVSGSDAWMNAALESYKQLCGQHLALNSSIPATVVEQITNLACPNECNGRGSCVNGSCHCIDGFSGTDCGFALNASLEYVDVYNNTCDMRSANCARARMLGVGIIPDVTTCHAQSITVDSNGISEVGSEQQVEIIFVSETEVHCLINSSTGAYVKLNNNGVASDRAAFVIYDSVCFKCNNDTGSFTCDKLAESCVIEGICYGPGEQSPNNACLVCTPNITATNFSASTADGCVTKSPVKTGSSDVGLIVGLVIGLSAFVAIVTGLSVFLYMKFHNGSAKLPTEYEHPPAYDDPAFNPGEIPIYGKASFSYSAPRDGTPLYDYMSSAGNISTASSAAPAPAPAAVTVETKMD